MRRRDAFAAAGIAVAIGLATALPALDRFEGLDIDSLHWLREQLAPVHHAPERSPVVVVAVDEATSVTKPFDGVPKVFWTPQIAIVLQATLDGGAKTIGWDVILPTSVRNVVRDEKYDALLRQYDRPLLRMLYKSRKKRQVVLGKYQLHLNTQQVLPQAAFLRTVGYSANTRSLNLPVDPDGIVRSVPLFFPKAEKARDGSLRYETSMALELAARAVDTVPILQKDGGVVFQGRLLPVADDISLRLNFDSGPGAIPIYSFADLYHCAAAGNTAYFEKHFAGRTILFGSVADLEDRKYTSKRLITRPDFVGAPPRCTNVVAEPVNDIARNSIPGVIAHATAINNILRANSLVRMPAAGEIGINLILPLIVACAAMVLRPARAGLAAAILGIAWIGAATWMFRDGFVLPLFDPLAGSVVTYGALLGYRFTVSDRDRNRIRRSFQFYLPQAVIDRMLEKGRMPELGGEDRELTVLFSDIQGYTAIAETLSPKQLVSFLNEYLSVVAETIETHGGFVDKYIGDAVVAVFGAPGEDPDHARQGVRAALACQAALAGDQRHFGLPAGTAVHTRIGLNTGRMLVGNIGSRQRFNYTVIGDAVNLASRLEGANKRYGSRILVSEDTVQRCGGDILFRELDRVRVAGRDRPVGIYEPIGLIGSVPASRIDQARRYGSALAQFRNREFAAAAAAFERLVAEGDPAAVSAAARAKEMQGAALPANWDGVTTLEEK